MANIQVEVEGQGAADAAAELLEIQGISGSWEFAEDSENPKEAILTTIATIVGLVGGTKSDRRTTSQVVSGVPEREIR